jgi:hypothetical protein
MLIGATLILWLSHRFATTYNAFCTPAYHDVVREQRTRFLIWPVMTIIATFAFVFAPYGMVSLDTWGKAQVLGTIFFLYNSYHFGIQHYGVMSIYRIRRGQGHGGWLKRYERVFCITIGTVLVALAQIGHGAEVVQDSIIYNLVPREAFLSAFRVLRVVSPTIIVGLASVFYIGEVRSQTVSVPKLLYATGLVFQGIAAYFVDPISFLILWGVQHWLVSVALGAHMTQNDRSEVPVTSRWYRFWHTFNRGFWPTVFILGLASVILTPLFQLAVHPERLAEGANFLMFLSAAVTDSFFARFFIALNFATVYIHFIMDRAIFRFSDPAIRKVSVPLLFPQTA